MKKLVVAALAALLALSVTAPTASARSSDADVVDALVRISSADGPDTNPFDYDLLIAAAGAVTVPEAGITVAEFLRQNPDITLWAPRDRAFVLLARDLGYQGRDEAGAGAFLLELDNATLFSVLAYHVTPEGLNAFEVLGQRTFDTVQGQTITRTFLSLQDQDPDDRDPRLAFPLNIQTGDGSVIHTINRVLRPIDL